MRSFYSGYTGNPELWIEFICAWQKLKGRELSRDPGFDLDAFVQDFPIDAPESYKHFMAATEALGVRDFLPVPVTPPDGGEESDFFSMLKPENVNCLALHDQYFGEAILDDVYEITIPMILASDKCRDFSEGQGVLPVSDGTHLFCNYVVGEYRDIGNEIYISLSPLLRSRDGEWVSCYFARREIIDVYFKSFAHLVAYIYMHDVIGFDDMRWRGIESDTLGYSRILFSGE